MRLIRFADKHGKIHTGCGFSDGTASVVSENGHGGYTDTNTRLEVAKILPPVVPPAVFCIGLNYRMHAEETGSELPKYPVIFMKNPSAVTGDRDSVVIPRSCIDPPQVDYEAELAVVIGKAAKNVKKETALDYVLGYACANDVSARRWQKHGGGGQWIKGKSFDTFCPIGPCIVTPDEIGDPNALDIECRRNGDVLQKSNTADMIFPVAHLIEFLSESATLKPGTVILTGTPSGVGFTRKPPIYLMAGDLLETQIEKIGTLTNHVTAEVQE